MSRRSIPRYAALFALIALALGLTAACDDDGENGGEATATPAAAEPTATVAAGTPGATPRENELGEAPIFYSPLDGFESLTAGEEYFVMFRVTNGYAENTLSIVAANAAGESVEFEPLRGDPVGDLDPPGSYYPTNITLPSAGVWTITVTAGEDVASFDVDAAEPDSGADLSDLRY